MKVSVVTAPGETRVVDAPKPTVGPADVLVKIRACGICGYRRVFHLDRRHPAGHDGGMPLGHEPAGEVVEVGGDVTGIAVGDHVVINPMAAPQRDHRQRRSERRTVRVPADRERGAGHQPRGRARPHPVRSGRAQRTHGRGPPRRQPLPTANRPTRCWSSAQARSDSAPPSRSNRLGSATSWSPT